MRNTRNFIRTTFVVTTAVASLAVFAGNAVGVTKSSGGPNTTMKALEDDGYDCGRIGSAGYECTKTGASTYYCDNNGTCISALVRPPRSKFVFVSGASYRAASVR